MAICPDHEHPRAAAVRFFRRVRMPIRYDKFNSMLEFRFEIRAEQPF